ncbi:MAG: hypothetical protein AAGC55_22540, partial [Myxococcota bacterium]
MTWVGLVWVAVICGSLLGCGDDGDDDGTTEPDATVSPEPDAGPGVDAEPEPDTATEPDAAVAPALRNPVDLSDSELASQALDILGQSATGPENCQQCHSLTRQELRHWRALTDQSLSNCITDTEVAEPGPARVMIDCLRAMPSDPQSMFDTQKLGLLSAAVHLDWFSYLFDLAYGADQGQAELAIFQQRVAMPRGEATPWTQTEFDVVAEWSIRGLPLLDELLPSDPPPSTCTPGVSAAVAQHVADMELSGWGAVNAENNLLMLGCTSLDVPLTCLTAYPQAGTKPYGGGWEIVPGSVLRVLRENDYRSAFWTRSSADGRYVAHGAFSGGISSAVVDLLRDVVVPTSALYDPSFFPDNSGFVFQGGQARICDQAVLDAAPAAVNYTEPGCSSTSSVGLYQHVGTALSGRDYWAVDGQFVSDHVGSSPASGDPAAYFSGASRLDFTVLANQGGVFSAGETITIPAPFEGDAVLSPSAELVINRVSGPGERQLGFVLRQVVATAGPTGYTIETPEIARYCVNGGKPGFSFDERWLVYHHYIDGNDAVDLG